MTKYINRQNVDMHEDLMDSMFKDRKRVFVDRLRWDVPAFGHYEIDQFDSPETEYLIVSEPGSHQHLGSIRLLQTDRPHLLGEVFSQLCDDGPPKGPQYREITRLCISPDISRREQLRVRNRLFTSAVEYALINGIQGYSGVMGMPVYQQVLSLGWRCSPLGLPCRIDGEMLAAVLAHVEPHTLTMFRAAGTYDTGNLRVAQAA